MSAKRTLQARGFTLIEILVAFAILAVVGAIAVVGYGQYTARAGAADLISRHHDIRTAVIANAATRSTENCADLVKGFDGSKLADPFATFSFGFEKVGNEGYRPVLSVCATAAQSGGVAVARRAHETLSKEGVVEKGEVLTDTLVSYALRLTPADQALCKNAPARAAGDACAAPQPAPVKADAQPPAAGAQPATVQAPVQPQPFNPATAVVPATVKAVAATATSCPAGQEMVVVTGASGTQRACAPTCQAGQRRTPVGSCIADVPPPQPAWMAQAAIPVSAPPASASGALPRCPTGQQLIATFVGGKLQQVCTKACPAGQALHSDGQCVQDKTPPAMCASPFPAADTYGGDCSIDFDGLCGEPEIAEVCNKTCGISPAPVLCSSIKVMAGTTPNAPTFPGWTPVFHSMMPRHDGESVYVDNDDMVKMITATSPDGRSPIQIIAIDFGAARDGASLQAQRQADGRWRITRVGVGYIYDGWTARITLDNGLGTNTVGTNWYP